MSAPRRAPYFFFPGAAPRSALRDDERHAVALLDRDLVAHRRPVSTNRITQELKARHAAYQVLRDGQIGDPVAIGDAESHSLAAVDHVDRHVEKAAVVMLASTALKERAHA